MVEAIQDVSAAEEILDRLNQDCGVRFVVMTSQDDILKFMETSGADWDVAKKFLDASGGKLQNAINLFFQDPNMFNQSAAPINPWHFSPFEKPQWDRKGENFNSFSWN